METHQGSDLYRVIIDRNCHKRITPEPHKNGKAHIIGMLDA